MLKDCIDIFAQKLKTDKSLVLDNYVPKDGSYRMVLITDAGFELQEPLDIIYNRKTGVLEGESDPDYKYLKQLDYYSRLLEMNKSMDPRKIIHSNNYLSFFVKQDSLLSGKVTDEIIDGYYDILKNPMLKYEKKAKTRTLYQSISQELLHLDQPLIDRIRNWLKQHLPKIPVDQRRTDYLKLFFVYPDRDDTVHLYEQEGQRYLIPHIYNSNEPNILIGSMVYGLPNNNIGMNTKKPFLEHKSRKVKEPYLLSMEEALLQAAFFDYLMGNASFGKVNMYVDTCKKELRFRENGQLDERIENGFFMRLNKGKELEILCFDMISGYHFRLEPSVKHKQILKDPEMEYSWIMNRSQLQNRIDEVFFNRCLTGNYFTRPEELAIRDPAVKYCLLSSRERLFSWFYKGDSNGIEQFFEQESMVLVKNCAILGNWSKARQQLNLRWSLNDYFSGTDDMELQVTGAVALLKAHLNAGQTWSFENDQEYYYAVGQLLQFALAAVGGQSGQSPGQQPVIKQIINAQRDGMIKKQLIYLCKACLFEQEKKGMENCELFKKILKYKPGGPVDYDILIGGLTGRRLI